MAIRFICPKGHRLSVPDERAGKRGRCSLCNQRVVVPLADDVPANAPVLDNQTGWAEVRFEGKPARQATAGVATPIKEEGTSTDLVEPLKPAKFVAQESSPPAASPAAKAPSPRPKPVPKPAVRQPKVKISSGESKDSPDSSSYRLDRNGVRRVYLLASAEAAMTLFVAVPAMKHLGSSGTPAWVWIVITLVAIQSLYILCVVTLPDWSTVWMGSLIFGLTSVMHLLGLAASLAITKESLPLGLAPATLLTSGWCAAVALLSAGMAFGCLRISRPWRAEYESQKASLRD